MLGAKNEQVPSLRCQVATKISSALVISAARGILGTVQSLLYNMAGAKRNGATAFFELVHNWVNTFY